MPQEGAPRVLHERISRGRSAVVDQLAAALEPSATPDPELAARLLSAVADEAARLLLADPERYPDRADPRARALVPAGSGSPRVTIGPRGAPRADPGARAPVRWRPVAGWLLRRFLWAVGTLVLTAFFAYGLIRLLRPELYPGESVVGGTVERA